MQATKRTRGRGAWFSFSICLFRPSTYVRYHTFLIEQGFEAFLSILSYSMRHEIAEALVQRFHARMGTFHLSCGEYTVLPLDWIAIFSLRFGEESVPTKFVSFTMASELLGIPYPLTRMTKGYFWPT